MSQPRCVFAYTAPGFEPEYLSLNVVNGELQITVRSAKDPNVVAPPTAMMTLPADQILSLAAELVLLSDELAVA